MAVPTLLKLYQGLLYQLDRFGAPTFEVAEFNYWWNFATRKFINKALEVFDLTQKVSDALRFLVVKKETEVNPTDETSLKAIDLPDDYVRLQNCLVTIRFKADRECFASGSTVQYKAERLTADKESFILNNTYHKPQWDRPYYQTVGNKLVLSIDTANYPDDEVVIEKVNFEYIKAPNVVELQQDYSEPQDDNKKCEFATEITDDITKICLKLILERQGDVQRLQTNTSLDAN